MPEKCDVRDLEGMRSIVDAVAEFGRPDVVVADAGIRVPATWDTTTPELFREHLDIDVVGTSNTVQVGASPLVERERGSIILISSYAGKKMRPFMVHYTIGKHAVIGMTRSFAAELGRHGIRVNSVHPGAGNTPMGSGDMAQALETAGQSHPVLNGMGTPFLPRYAAEPDDVAASVAFLASDDAAMITAEHVSVDAGTQYF